MRRRIIACIINMHKRPVHNGHTLQEVRQNLAQIMGILQRHARVQHNVHLDEQLVACVVGAQVLDASYGGGETHCQVQQQVALVRLCGEAGQVADVVGGGLGPLEDDEEGEEEAARGVEPPNVAIETNCVVSGRASRRGRGGEERTDWEEDGADVEDDVCFGILRSGIVSVSG